MTEPRACPSCGVALPTRSVLAGLCPACTWNGLWEEEGLDERVIQQAPIKSGLMRVPGYEVVEEIARGGMGIVYRARQFDPPRTVALKMLLPYQLGSPEMAQRFRMEVRALTELEHPAILPVYQVGEHEGLPFFTMKLASGGTLAQRKHRLIGQWRKIAELTAALADAVQFAHDRGVLHRDLKPGNILFDENDRPYVSDFGLAKLVTLESDLTRTIEFLGTPHYVAPEVAAGSARCATTASDVYSLGAVLYELLGGRPPFEAEGIPALLRQVAEDDPARLPGVPRDLEVICRKCLAKEAKGRYATARELADDLRRWLAGMPILARPATHLERLRAWSRRNPALAAMILLVLVILSGAVWLQTRANRRLQESLANSLLAQARMQRESGRAGQRFATLSLATQAAGLGPSTMATKIALRTEIAGALALPDVRVLSQWPVHVAHFENIFSFSSNLATYAAATPDGGFGVFSSQNRQPIWQAPGISNNPVVTLRLSPDSAWVAAQFQDGHSELHAVKSTGPAQNWVGRISPKSLCTFSASADSFAIAEPGRPMGHTVEVWSLPDVKHRATVRVPVPPTALAFDPSGQRLVIAANDLTVWNLTATNRLWKTPLENDASALAWSPDGRWIAVALDLRLKQLKVAEQDMNPVWLHDAATGRPAGLFSETRGRIEHLAFHPDGQSLALADWGGELIWGSLPAHGFRLRTEAAQRALDFSADGTRIAYSPSRDQLAILELAQPQALREWTPLSEPVRNTYAIAVSSDGRWVATGTDTKIQLWDAENRREIASHNLPAPHWWVTLMFSHDDAFLYYGAFSFGVRKVQLVREIGSSTAGGQVRFGPDQLISPGNNFLPQGFAADGRSLIVSQNRRTAVNDRIPPTIWYWPHANPAHARKLVENYPLVGYRAIGSSTAGWAVSADLISPDATIWNIHTGKPVRTLGIPLPVSCEIAPNGRWLITRTRHELAVWEVGTWKPLSRTPVGPDEQASSWVVASPDSRLLVNRTGRGDLILRALPNAQKLLTLPAPRSGQVFDFRFHPSADRLFVLLKNGRLYEWHFPPLRHQLARLQLDWQASAAPRQKF